MLSQAAQVLLSRQHRPPLVTSERHRRVWMGWGVVVKGAELRHFVSEGVALAIFTTVLLTVASIKFSRNRKRAK